MFWMRTKSLAPAGNQTLDQPAQTVVDANLAPIFLSYNLPKYVQFSFLCLLLIEQYYIKITYISCIHLVLHITKYTYLQV